MTKSDNEIGNPWHGEDGKFTSPGAADLGVSVENFEEYLKNGKSLVGLGMNLSDDALDIFDELFSDFDVSDDALNVLDEIAEDDNEVAKLPPMSTADEIVDALPTILGNKQYMESVVKHYNWDDAYDWNRYNGKFNAQDPDIAKTANVFIQNLAEVRFNKARANIISYEQYVKDIAEIEAQGSGQLNAGYDKGLIKNSLITVDKYSMEDNLTDPTKRDLGCGKIAVFRGIRMPGDAVFKKVKETYAGVGNTDLIPVMSSGGSLASCYYFSMQHSYSKNHYCYAQDPRWMISGIIHVDDKTRITTKDESMALRRAVRDKISANPQIKQNIQDEFRKHVDDDAKAAELTKYFLQTLIGDDGYGGGSDYGLVNIIAGKQMIFGEKSNGMQCDLYDLSILDIVG